LYFKVRKATIDGLLFGEMELSRSTGIVSFPIEVASKYPVITKRF
jgi:hypothetical protein